MREHERNRIHTVGKPVCDYREGDRHSHRRIYLESKPDSDTVEKAVAYECRSGKRADVWMVVVSVVAFVVMVDKYRLFEKVKDEEAHDERDHRVGSVESGFMGDFENFWKDFERGDPQEHSGRERHDEMEPIFEFERNESTKKYRNESNDGKYGGIYVHNAKSDDKTEYIHFFPTPNQIYKTTVRSR